MDEARLLLVEDEPLTCRMLAERLRKAGFSVAAVASAEAALDLLMVERFAVLVTDLLLQQLDGLALLVKARGIDPDLAVIILTGAASLDTAIAAVHAGAHSYLRKPVPAGELEGRLLAALAQRHERIESRLALRHYGAHLLRLADGHGPPYELREPGLGTLRLGRLELDTMRRRASINRRAVPLSNGEFDLLHYLACHEHQVVSAEQLAREALHFRHCTADEARDLMKVRIHRLRQKIEANPHSPDLLISVRGAGYMLTSGE